LLTEEVPDFFYARIRRISKADVSFWHTLEGIEEVQGFGTNKRCAG